MWVCMWETLFLPGAGVGGHICENEYNIGYNIDHSPSHHDNIHSALSYKTNLFKQY